MKKVLFVIFGIIAGLLVLVIIGAPLVDWRFLESRINALVSKSLGRTLQIDGAIRLSLVPDLTFSISGAHLSNLPGMPSPKMLSADRIEGRVRFLPLLSRQLVIEELVIEAPTLHLGVDGAGRPNWEFEATEPAPAGMDDGALPIEDLRLSNVQIVNGAVSYVDIRTGRVQRVREVFLQATLPRFTGELNVDGRAVVMDNPIALQLTVDDLVGLLAGRGSSIAVQIETETARAHLAGTFEQEPHLGMNGTLELKAPSIARLAAWLDYPLDRDLPDPGALSFGAVFAMKEGRIDITEGVLRAPGIDAWASGSLDADGDVPVIIVDLETGVLVLDTYLPIEHEMPTDDREWRLNEVLAGLSDAPLDLDLLRDFEGQARVVLGGMEMAGFEVGKANLIASLHEDIVTAKLEWQSPGMGAAKSEIRLDASSDDLMGELRAELTEVRLDGILGTAISGTTTATCWASTHGPNARALARNLIGHLSFDLTRAALEGLPPGALSDARAELDVPGLDARPALSASGVYKGETIRLDVTLDPLEHLMTGEPLALLADVASAMLTAHYEGDVIVGPDLGLDGVLRVDVPSAAGLAAWFGYPLGQAQPDPGAIVLETAVAATGRSVTLTDARIEGSSLSVRGSGALDSSGRMPRLTLRVAGGLIDLDRLLGLASADTVPDAAAPGAPDSGFNPFADLSETPLDTSALRALDVDAQLALERIRLRGRDMGPIAIRAVLEDGVLEFDVPELTVLAGSVSAQAKLDASGAGMVAEAKLAFERVPVEQVADLLGVAPGTVAGPISGSIVAATRGVSPRDLAKQLSGEFAIRFDALEIESGLTDVIRDGTVTLRITGVDAPLKTAGRARLQDIDAQPPTQSELTWRGTTGSLSHLLENDTLALDIEVDLGDTRIDVTGEIGRLSARPEPSIDVALAGDNLRDLGAHANAALPSVGPYRLKGHLTRDGAHYRIADLDARIGQSDVSGNLELSREGSRLHLGGTLKSTLLDITEFIPVTEVEEPDKQTDMPRFIPDTPLPLDLLRATDADLSIVVGTLRLDEAVEIADLDAGLTLQDGRLEVMLLSATAFDGVANGRVVIDASAEPPTVGSVISVNNMDLGLLLARLRATDKVKASFDHQHELTGTGQNLRQIANTLTGWSSLDAGEGTIDAKLLSFLTIGPQDFLTPLFGGAPDSKLTCIASRTRFESGLATITAQIIDTISFTIVGTGTVDLRDEALDLHYVTSSQKVVSLTDIVAVPFHVAGTLKDPSISADVAGTITGTTKVVSKIRMPGRLLGMFTEAGTGRGGNPCLAALERDEALETKGSVRRGAKAAGGAVKGVGSMMEKGLKGLFGNQ